LSSLSISVLALHFSSQLLFLQYLSKLVACSYYYFILFESLSASISFLLIIRFISFLNFFTNFLPSYSLSLTVLLNSYTNSSIIFLSYFIFLSSVTLANSLLLPSNSFVSSAKKSLADANYTSPASISSNKFFFQISANSSCTYIKIYWTCSFTSISLILILIYNLHAVTNSTT